jgi:signal transduction histidine kinase
LQVLVNILSNAVKFSPTQSSIEISSRKLGKYVGIDVADRGPGIPAELQEHIFDRYVQAKRGGGGFGLGLAIAREIIELQGGTISVSSREQGGSIFTITIPLANQ